MDLPEVVREALNGESVAARVGLGGDDVLFVTPTRTLVYRGDGLLSDESVTEYPHGAERIAVETGRRKSKVHLDYGLDGERTLGLPTDRLEDALHPMLAGVLNRAEVTKAGETVTETFLLSELTVVVTSQRLVRHVGEAVWDGEFEEYHYDDVTDLRFEEGNVATSVVIQQDDVQERFKVPNDRARAFRERLVAAALAYHEYDSLEAFRDARAPTGAESEADDADTVDFGDGPAPLTADPEHVESVTDVADADEPAGARAGAGTKPSPERAPESEPDPRPVADSPAEADGEGEAEPASGAGPETATPVEADEGAAPGGDSFAGSGFESAGPVDEGELVKEIGALREAVEEQNELLRDQGRRIEKQGELFRQLVEELRQQR